MFTMSQHLFVRMRVAMAVGEAVFSEDMFDGKDVNGYMSEMST